MLRFCALSGVRWRNKLVPKNSSSIAILEAGQRRYNITTPSPLRFSGEPLKYSYSMLSYFTLPEQNVYNDSLSRSSLFIIKRNNSEGKKVTMHFLGCAHVSHPHRWKKLYDAPQYYWLDYLRDSAVTCNIGFHEQYSGRVIKEFPFSEKCFHHEELDLIAFHLKDEAEFLNWLKNPPFPYMSLNPIPIRQQSVEEGEDLTIVGHGLVVKGEEEFMIPGWCKAHVNMVEGNNVFLKTPAPLPMGICGGPVMDKQGQCVGTIQASVGAPEDPVPKDPQMKMIHHNGVMIEGKEIFDFINKIEAQLD